MSHFFVELIAGKYILIAMSDIQLDESRKKALGAEFTAPYFAELKEKLLEEKKLYTIYPPSGLIFNALNTTPLERVKVVILGQDPYHGPGQAMGLSFSVPKGVALPPSLKNIYQEINTELGISIPTSGDLTYWAQQGVLLLNAFLTVRAGQPASHQKLGREHFTDAVIKAVSDTNEHVVFLLRGNFARSKKVLIDTSKHLVLESPHPSPFSVHSGFFGNNHFSKTNEYLETHNIKSIDWRVDPEKQESAVAEVEEEDEWF